MILQEGHFGQKVTRTKKQRETKPNKYKRRIRNIEHVVNINMAGWEKKSNFCKKAAYKETNKLETANKSPDAQNKQQQIKTIKILFF